MRASIKVFMSSSNSDRQMATIKNEHYWRLYLFLNEGVSFLSRGIIVRKLDVLGLDLSFLLRENEKQIEKNDNLDSSDLDILFPVDGETNLDKWNPNMYLCVLLELFRASLKPRERTKLEAVQQVLKYLYERQKDTKIDYLTYKEHVDNLEEAFLVLTINEDSRMKIVEIKKVYIDEPLNFDSVQDQMAKMEFHSSTKQNPKNNLDKMHEDIGKDTDFNKKQTKAPDITSLVEHRDIENTTDERDSDVNNSIKDDSNGCDRIGACATNEDSENSSDGIGPIVISRNVEHKTDSTEDFAKCFKKEGIMGLQKHQKLNIAVIGRTGVGKSRFINAIRGCKEGDPEYAQIDVNEATISVEKYPAPKNSLLVYWELPGIGTDNFPRGAYIKMKEINFFAYDLYLIVCANRFTEDEIYLAKTLEESGKTFLFVRTKADIHEGEFQDFKSVLENMRKHFVEYLSSRNIQANDVYLISSIKVDHKLLEFDRLVERLVYSLPDLKKEALLLSLRFNTKTLIKEKRTQLINRAKLVSTLSAAAGTVPGLSFCVDYKLIQNELDVYRHTLLITERNLLNLADKTGIDVNELKSKYKLKSFTLLKDGAIGATQFFAPTLKNIAMSEVARMTATLIPFVGTAIRAGISGCTTYRFLTSTLETLVQDAETMLDILLEKTGSSTFESN